MQRTTFDHILSFLLGFAWALLVIGVYIIYQTAIFLGIPITILLIMIYLFFMLFAILLLEALHSFKEREIMMYEQTELLRTIARQLRNTEE